MAARRDAHSEFEHLAPLSAPAASEVARSSTALQHEALSFPGLTASKRRLRLRRRLLPVTGPLSRESPGADSS